ncbi:MAG: DNA polymerase III subunit gamma/tau [Gaiellaceae bacterium]
MSTALYRKYRPQSFDDVVGQDDVVRTLRNAIEQDKLRQAYLFSGPRGTGKTSLARILAKALNCEQGPTASPCGVCTSCTGVAAGNSLDVIEMDAASQRGIDDVREIRERAVLQPVSRYKIYILDEAHQLTKDAFNALLKLIEEPPPHLLFVFCTTELDKMLATVRSRCQTLQFARPRLPDMANVLRRIAESEGIEAPDAALAQVAQSARGSFRDAISTFDQLAAATGGDVELAAVLRLLGVVEEDALFRLIDLVVDGDTRGALMFVEELAEQGQDIGRFVTDLLEHLRRLVLLRHLDEVPAALPVTAESGERLRSQANQLGEGTILRFVDLLAIAVEEEREGGDPRLPLELALVRITRPASDGAADAVLARLERLERALETDGTPAPTGTARTPDPAPSQTGEAPVPPPPADEVAAHPREEALPPAPPSAAATEQSAVPAAAADVPPPTLGLAEVKQLWKQSIVPAIRERSIPSGSVFAEAQVVAMDGDDLTLLFPSSASFHLKLAEDSKHASLAGRVLKDVLGRSVRVSCQLADAPAPVAEPASTDAPQPAEPPLVPAGQEIVHESTAAAGATATGLAVAPQEAPTADSGASAEPADGHEGDAPPVVTDPVDDFVSLLKDTLDAEEVQGD